jgi:glycosyltransferase involved in cell wall biosynthesis
VGRLDSWKRPGLLLEALPHVPEAKAVFVGGGPESARLRARAEELGLAGRVRFLEDVDDETLLGLYADSRLVAVTASGEDLGYVPLEAFLSGKAVLTTEDAGGPLEFVRDGETGLVVAPRPDALGVALRLAWSRPDALAALGEAGRRRAAALSWDEPVAKLLAAAGLSSPSA